VLLAIVTTVKSDAESSAVRNRQPSATPYIQKCVRCSTMYCINKFHRMICSQQRTCRRQRCNMPADNKVNKVELSLLELPFMYSSLLQHIGTKSEHSVCIRIHQFLVRHILQHQAKIPPMPWGLPSVRSIICRLY
jgi:hypothetical protein